MIEIGARSIMTLAHIASRGIGLSLMSDQNGFITDRQLARRILRDAGYSEQEVSDLADLCSGLSGHFPKDIPGPVGTNSHD